jgi:hypothetical protein
MKTAPILRPAAPISAVHRIAAERCPVSGCGGPRAEGVLCAACLVEFEKWAAEKGARR